MSDELTIAMYNRGRFEGAAASAQSWKGYAEKTEAKFIKAAAGLAAERALVGEIMDELEGKKPLRLSDPANRQMRIRFREEAKQSSEKTMLKIGAAALTIE